MPSIRARAPLRLGLAGGGSDVSPYCDVYGGCVLSAAIDRYAYAVIKLLDQPVVRFVACDQHLEQERQAKVPYLLDGKMNLHAATYNYIIKNFNNVALCQSLKLFSIKSGMIIMTTIYCFLKIKHLKIHAPSGIASCRALRNE